MLVDFYKKAGIEMIDAFGVEYPLEFTETKDEYDALNAAAGVIDLTHRHILEVTGGDRASFLNAMLTNEIASLENGEGCHALMTTPKGKIVSELFVLAGRERHLVVVAQGDFTETYQVLEKHVISEDVVINDLSEAYGIIAVEGPKATSVLTRVLRMGPMPKSRLDWVDRDFDNFSTKIFAATATGEAGYHLIVPAVHVVRFRNYLVQAARGSEGLAVGHDAWETRRVENGLPWYGVDFTNDNFPQEVRLDHTVSYTKGCFRGHETLARIHNRGNVKRVLVGLIMADGASKPNHGELPTAAIKSVVSRGARGSVLMLGYVPKESGDPGNEVALELDNGLVRLEVVDLPSKHGDTDGD